MKNWYQTTEKLLYRYPCMQARISALELELEEVNEKITPKIIATYKAMEGKSYQVSNPIEETAIKRMEVIKKIEKQLKKTRTMQKVIEQAVATLGDEEKELVRLFYWKNLNWEVVSEALGMSRYPFYTRKNQLVKKLAWCFGFVEECDLKMPLKKH